MVRVHYQVSEVSEDSAGNGDFLDSNEEGDKDIMLDFSSGATSVDLTIQLANDDTSEANARITVKLLAEDPRGPLTYFVSDTKNTASVIAIDDDGDPQIVIAPENSPITEGEAAIFNLTANFDIQSSVNVQFTVVQVGDFVLWRIPGTFAMTESMESFSIETHDDELYEPDDGSITITLIAVPSVYTIQPDNSATVQIEDNDFAADSLQRPEPAPRISVANTAVNAIVDFLQDSNTGSAPSEERAAVLPTVTIHTENTIIAEGSPAEFTLASTTLSETSAISVKLSVNPFGDFFDFVDTTLTSVRLQGTNSVPIIYQTIDDTIAEDDGRLEVAILADSSYHVANSQSSAFVIISDAVDRKDATRCAISKC